jgi:hypothetical protein
MIPRDTLTEVSDEQIELLFEAIHSRIGADSPYNKVKIDMPAADVRPELISAVTAREREYATAALKSECEKLAAMGAGSGRNNGLNVAAHSLGTMTIVGWIDAKTVAPPLFNAAIANGYVAKRGEDAAEKTIMSGLNAGTLKPRTALPEGDAQSYRALLV